MPPGVTNPPSSVREGVAHLWAAAIREAIRTTEGRDIDPRQVPRAVVPHGLHLDYNLDFRTRRADDIAPVLTSPLLSGLVNNISQLRRPAVPREPTPFKMDGDLWDPLLVIPKSEVPGPSLGGGWASKRPTTLVDIPDEEPFSLRGSSQDQPPLEPDREKIVEIDISGDRDSILQETQSSFIPNYEPVQTRKRQLRDNSPQSSPPGKRAAKVEVESTPRRVASLPTGVKEEDLLPKWYETFTMDHTWAQRVRGSLLGLKAGVTPSQKDIDTLECFIPRTVALESELPDVVTEHWLPILRADGLLAECHPDKFIPVGDWVPLYTPAGLRRHLPAVLSAFPNTELPSLTAVVPPDLQGGTDREFLLMNFHKHDSLKRQSLYGGTKCRQLAFCPYCGVINENFETALSHMRKHLNLLFVCGGCYAKSFPPMLHVQK